MSVYWPDAVNHNAYDENGGFVGNRQTLKFESGKERSYLINSSPKKSHSFTIAMEYEPNGDCEFKRFLDWYENELLSGTLSFYFPDIFNFSHDKSTWKEYMMTSEPSWDDSQNPKIVSISIKEE